MAATLEERPVHQAERTVVNGINDTANGLYSLPDAAARSVVGAIHGQEAVEQAAGPFDPKPLTTMSERFKDLKTQSYQQRAENRDTGPRQI